MVDFKAVRAAAPEYAELDDNKFIEALQQQYAPSWSLEDVADKVGYKLPTKPNALLAATPNFVESGIRTWQQGIQPIKELVGLQSQDETAKNLAWLQRRKGEIAPEKGGTVAKGIEEIQNAQGWGETTKAIVSNPQALLRNIGESVATFLPDLALAPVTGMGFGAIAKTLATRFAAKALAPEAVAAAVNVGKAVHIGGGSAKTEYASELLDILKDKGVDIESSSSVQKAFSDPELMSAVKKTALLKAIPVGVFDAFSMGLAGKIIDPALGAARAARSAGTALPLGSLAARGAGELGLQAGLGAAGEATGQLAAHGEIKDKAAVLLEAFGELGGAPFEAYSNLKSIQKGREQGLAETEQAKAAQEAERLSAEQATLAKTQEETKLAEARRSANLAQERATAAKSADLALTQDEGLGTTGPTEREQTYGNIRAQEEDRSRLYAPWQKNREEQKLISDIVEELGLSENAKRELEQAPRGELVKVAQALLQQNPELKKIPNLASLANEAQQEVKALPAPRVETPYGAASPQQLNRLVNSTLDPKIARDGLTDGTGKPLGEQLPGNAGPRLPLTNEVENILKSNLPDSKKNELLLALSNNPDIQQNQDTAGNDVFVGTPRGEVITQPQARQESNDQRLEQNQQIDKREQKVQLAEAKFNTIKGNASPENSFAAARILADLEASGTLDQLKIPRLQALVREATGKPFPLKPASDALKAYKALPGTDTLSVPEDASSKVGGPPQWGPFDAPEGVSQEKWNTARGVAAASSPGDNVTPRKLMDAGLTSGEAYKATRALRKQGILSGKDTYERTDKPVVTYSNVLSPTNALNFLKNEWNGKNYGCM